jgi:hypothetical protein
MSSHAQHLIWSKLHDAQYAAYERNPEAWNMYFNNHTDLHKTPLIVRHLNQSHCQKPILSVRQVVQQIQAHERCRIAGGPQNLDKDEFYDLFIRPLEFMACRGMPLHSCLISGIHSFSARCNMARQLIETAGFSIYDPLPITPHYIFSEVSKIRHLESHTLLPQDTGYLIPIARLENMPRITNIFQTKRMQGKVDIKDFEPHGKLHNFQPNHFIPIPEHILNMFKELGGTDIPLCDHVALNHEIIRHHRLYICPPVPKPRSVARKTVPAKQSSSSSGTSSSSESGAPKSKQTRNKSIDSPSLLKKQHSREESTSKKPKQVSQGPPKPKSPKQTDPLPPVQQQSHPDPKLLEQDFTPQLPTIVDPVTGTLMPQAAMHPSDAKIQMTVTQLNQMLQARHMHALTSQKRSMETPQTKKIPIASTSLFQHRPAAVPMNSAMNSAFETTDWYDTLTLTQSPSQIPSSQVNQAQSSTYTCSPILPTSHLQPQPSTSSSTTYPVPRYHPSITTRPQWLDDIRKEIDDQILPSSLIWSCTSHYKTPTWAKVAHSAWSLYNIVDHKTPMSEGTKGRYTQMPTFRRFPADGLNHIHDFSIMFESVMNNELITFKDTAMLYRTAPHTSRITLDRQIVTEVSIPSQIYSRFISQFYDIAEEQLRPAFKDMQEAGDTLLEKTCHILNYQFTYRIFISEGRNGLERLVKLSIQKGAYSKKDPASITFPWIRMGSILVAMKEVLTDLQHQKLL